MRKSRTFIAISPGTTIKEQLVDRGMKQKEFAVRMGMSEKHISKLINGDVQLTIEMARKLEMVLGLPTQFWCNLEAIYREDLAKVREENTMDEDIAIAKNMPYEQMTKNGWIVETSQNVEKVIHLRKYFELAELKYLQTAILPRIACRKISGIEKDDCALIAWAQKAKLEARKVETKTIDIEKLKVEIPHVCKVLIQKENGFELEIREILAECGIAMVVLPRLEDGFLHGATFRDGNKIVLGLNDSEDINELKFSLFHELAHILQGHVENDEGISEKEEECANEYARSMLEKISIHVGS